MVKTSMKTIKNSTIATMDLLTCMVIDGLAQEQSITHEEALVAFLSSRTADALYHNEAAKLWWDGPAVLTEMYLNEQ